MTSATLTHPCSNCGSPVAARRPSKTGKHWCSAQVCTNAKQRYYYENRHLRSSQERAAAELENVKLLLVTALAQEQWLTDGCPDCGQSPALVDWVHPKPDWSGKCFGAGSFGDVSEMTPYFKAVWPTNCPF